MYEIELKAHVQNRNEVLSKIKQFATYLQTVERRDTYFSRTLEKPLNGKDYISIRIREEIKETPEGNETSYLMTYKQKENRIDSSGITTEINNEKESVLTNPDALKSFLIDDGFYIKLKKLKKVEDYTCKTQCGQATLELCNIPPLGDFLEIEILSETNDERSVQKAQQELKKLLQMSGVPETQIEPRYYSELLKEAGETN